jgi:hypothetical protein
LWSRVRPPKQGELDVVAVAGRRAVAAEVATHIVNLDYGGYEPRVQRDIDKLARAGSFLAVDFPEHERHVLGLVGVKMLVSDVYHVPVGASLAAIAVILTVSVVASLLRPSAAADAGVS